MEEEKVNSLSLDNGINTMSFMDDEYIEEEKDQEYIEDKPKTLTLIP